MTGQTHVGSCLVCVHAKLFDQGGAIGHYCIRMPPSVVALPSRNGREIQFHGVFPPVDKDSRPCGEYRPELPTAIRSGIVGGARDPAS